MFYRMSQSHEVRYAAEQTHADVMMKVIACQMVSIAITGTLSLMCRYVGPLP